MTKQERSGRSASVARDFDRIQKRVAALEAAPAPSVDVDFMLYWTAATATSQYTVASWTEGTDTANYYSSGSELTIPTGLGGMYAVRLYWRGGCTASSVGAALTLYGNSTYSSGFHKTSGGTVVPIGSVDTTSGFCVLTVVEEFPDAATVGAKLITATAGQTITDPYVYLYGTKL